MTIRRGSGKGYRRGFELRGLPTLRIAPTLSMHLHLHLLRNHTYSTPAPAPAPKHRQAPSACMSGTDIFEPHVTVTALAGADMTMGSAA